MEPTLLLLAGLAAGAAAGWLIQQMRMRVKLAENDRGHQEGLTAMKAQHLEETTLRVTEHRERAAGLQGCRDNWSRQQAPKS